MPKQKRLLFGPLAGLVVAMLLAGSILAPASLAAAEKEKENDHDKDDKNNKCSQHKYDGKCDKQKPKVKILWPTNNAKLTGPAVTIAGIALDTGSGIKQVKLQIDGKSPVVVSTSNIFWFDNVSLSKGTHHVVVRAYDKANNEAEDHVTFKVK